MKRLIGFICLLMLVGCLPPTQAQLKMDNDLEEMKRRLALIEQGSSDGGSQARRQVETLGRQVAELQSGLDTLRVESQSLNGRLDDLGRRNEQATADMELVRDDLGLQISVLTERLTTLEQKLTAQPEKSPTAEPQATVKTSPEEDYQKALEKILQGTDFSAGRAEMKAFVRDFPQHELAINAKYWIGEAYYGEKKYDNAILQFQEVITRYSDHPKAAAALLKQGMAFQALGDMPNAKTTWKQLIKTFPLSPEAEKAKTLLK